MITSKEWYIMQVLWENGACSLMEIVAHLDTVLKPAHKNYRIKNKK